MSCLQRLRTAPLSLAFRGLPSVIGGNVYAIFVVRISRAVRVRWSEVNFRTVGYQGGWLLLLRSPLDFLLYYPVTGSGVLQKRRSCYLRPEIILFRFLNSVLVSINVVFVNKNNFSLSFLLNEVGSDGINQCMLYNNFRTFSWGLKKLCNNLSVCNC